jgi:4-amino-4-deoxy-L-arabinose transferase-like glycosyltransferase
VSTSATFGRGDRKHTSKRHRPGKRPTPRRQQPTGAALDAPRRAPALIAIAVCAACVAVVPAAGRALGGWSQLRRYGTNLSNGISWASQIAPREAAFLLVLTTAGVVAIAALSHGIRVLAPETLWRSVTGFLFATNRRLFLGILMAAVVVSTQLIGSHVLHHSPITDDEGVYLLQARIFAQGRLYVDSPEPREFFDNIFVVNNGRFYGQYPAGHPALLAFGVLLGAPRLIPSLLAAATLPLILGIGCELGDERTGRLAALLLCASPFFILTSSTLLPGPSSLFFVSLAIWAALRVGSGEGGLGAAFLASAAGGLAFLVHPPSATVFLFPVYAYLLLGPVRRSPGAIGKAAALAAGGLVIIAIFLTLNKLQNGGWLVTGYQALWGGKAAQLGVKTPFGFGTFLWGIKHTPALGLRNTLVNLLRTDFWLFGSAISLLPAIVGAWSTRHRAWTRVFLVASAATVVLYFFYFWPGISDTGPVNYYLLLLPLVVLSALGLGALGERLQAAPQVARRRLPGAAAAALLAVATFTFWPVQLQALRTLGRAVSEPYRLLATGTVHNALVFTPYYLNPDAPKSWVAGRRNNSPELDDDVLYVRDLGPARDFKLMAMHPERSAYRLVYRDGRPIVTRLKQPRRSSAGPQTWLGRQP